MSTDFMPFPVYDIGLFGTCYAIVLGALSVQRISIDSRQ